jgi:hypothetical protein
MLKHVAHFAKPSGEYIYIDMCMGLRVTKIMGSSSDD